LWCEQGVVPARDGPGDFGVSSLSYLIGLSSVPDACILRALLVVRSPLTSASHAHACATAWCHAAHWTV
jgi:hypothetical protein